MAAREEVALPSASALPEFAQSIWRPFANFITFTRRKPIGGISAIFLVAIILAAIAAPLLATHDPIASDTPNKLQAPSAQHFFGTDELGRDIFSRILYGARVSLVVGYFATLLATVIGTIVALISGYLGGKVDLIIQRFVDAFQAVPQLLVVLTVVTILDPTVWNLVLVIGLLFGVREVRPIRSQVLAVRVMPYVEAARTVGASVTRIMWRHVLPNVMYVIIVVGSLSIGRVILVEASLGFLGFGVPPPNPTWGQMLSGSARRFMTEAPWMGIAPGVAISLTVLAFNMLGDALRDVLDPRLRGSEERR